MTATHNCKVTKGADVLYLAFELGETQWKLAFTIGAGQKPRLRSMPARDLPRLREEIAKAKKRFQLPVDAAGLRHVVVGAKSLQQFLQVGTISRWNRSVGLSSVHLGQIGYKLRHVVPGETDNGYLCPL
jgi:hypothetical protein